MTAGEFAFLAMGLILGVAAGAALVEVLRARPPAAREVRLTVASDAVPRRGSTLADDAFSAGPEPARGGPADRRDGVMGAHRGPDRRTPVPFRIWPDTDEGFPMPGRMMVPAFRLAGGEGGGRDDGQAAHGLRARVPAGVVRTSVADGMDPFLGALRAGATSDLDGAGGGRRSTAVLDRAVGDAVAASGQLDEDDGLPRLAAASPSAPAIDGPCAEPRRLADERCQLATLARTQAGIAEDALRSAQHTYQDHESRAAAAAEAADPRAIRRAKDDAQVRFRTERSVAGDQDAIEAAARNWLAEINRINGAAREASAALEKEREAARAIGASLERLSIEADAARISAESAEETCLAARTVLADCEEGQGPTPPDASPSDTPPDPIDEGGDESLAVAYGSGGTPRIFRLVRGDRAALIELVDGLAGEDPEARRRWQSSLADLVDAILADAIESSALTFPEEHPFWGPFSVSQSREITTALSSLGLRFDGLGGWVEDRVPTQRELSMALGYAGLDPMRIRQWPTETEMRELFRDVAVAADEHLAAAAGDLTLGELVAMLGRRADGLTDVWNAWGRIRPLLLEER